MEKGNVWRIIIILEKKQRMLLGNQLLNHLGFLEP